MAKNRFVNIKFIGQGAVIRSLTKIRDLMTRESVLRDIAEAAVDLIKVRTLEGRDENDRPLIASKRADRKGGQTLSDKGHMLGSMRVLSVSPKRATIGFGSMTEAKKAWWAQDGTDPHDIFAKPGGALAFKSSMSGATHMLGGYQTVKRNGVDVRRRKATKLTMANARSNAQGFVLAQHVHHPGTPKRPFFGISRRDAGALQELADTYVARALEKASA